MARKKGTPQKAPEYKKKAPGKAKDGSACYTRVNKGGGAQAAHLVRGVAPLRHR